MMRAGAAAAISTMAFCRRPTADASPNATAGARRREYRKPAPPGRAASRLDILLRTERDGVRRLPGKRSMISEILEWPGAVVVLRAEHLIRKREDRIAGLDPREGIRRKGERGKQQRARCDHAPLR